MNRMPESEEKKAVTKANVEETLKAAAWPLPGSAVMRGVRVTECVTHTGETFLQVAFVDNLRLTQSEDWMADAARSAPYNLGSLEQTLSQAGWPTELLYYARDRYEPGMAVPDIRLFVWHFDEHEVPPGAVRITALEAKDLAIAHYKAARRRTLLARAEELTNKIEGCLSAYAALRDEMAGLLEAQETSNPIPELYLNPAWGGEMR